MSHTIHDLEKMVHAPSTDKNWLKNCIMHPDILYHVTMHRDASIRWIIYKPPHNVYILCELPGYSHIVSIDSATLMDKSRKLGKSHEFIVCENNCICAVERYYSTQFTSVLIHFKVASILVKPKVTLDGLHYFNNSTITIRNNVTKASLTPYVWTEDVVDYKGQIWSEMMAFYYEHLGLICCEIIVPFKNLRMVKVTDQEIRELTIRYKNYFDPEDAVLYHGSNSLGNEHIINCNIPVNKIYYNLYVCVAVNCATNGKTLRVQFSGDNKLQIFRKNKFGACYPFPDRMEYIMYDGAIGKEYTK